jgi:hypothetical protein
MPLPKIEYPLFKIKTPSTGDEKRYRPFLVKEEKILLMAKATDQQEDMMTSIMQVVNNCCVDDIDVDELSLFDLEYIFLKIRAQSVDSIVKVSYKDFEDEKTYDFDIDLTSVEVKFPDNLDSNIKLSELEGFIMKYPRANLYKDKDFISAGDDALFQLVIRCVDKIYDADKVYEAKDYTKKEISEYLEGLDIKTFDKVRDYVVNQPKISYEINYKNSLGNDRKIELTTLTDFFTLR